MNSFFNELFFESFYPSCSKFPEGDLRINLPGIGRDNISVEVDGGRLVVTAKREGSDVYTGRWSLPYGSNSDEIRAKYIDGVLSISLSSQENKKKTILIE